MFPFENELHKSYPVHTISWNGSPGTYVLWLEKITLESMHLEVNFPNAVKSLVCYDEAY